MKTSHKVILQCLCAAAAMGVGIMWSSLNSKGNSFGVKPFHAGPLSQTRAEIQVGEPLDESNAVQYADADEPDVDISKFFLSGQENAEIESSQKQHPLRLESFLGFKFGTPVEDLCGSEFGGFVEIKRWRTFSDAYLDPASRNKNDSGMRKLALNSGAYTANWSDEKLIVEASRVVEMLEKKYGIRMTRTGHPASHNIVAHFRCVFDNPNCSIVVEAYTGDISLEVVNKRIGAQTKSIDSDEGADRL